VSLTGKQTPEWPASGLETVSRCPICGKQDRKLDHSRLRDRVFRSAPGEWNLYRCGECGTGYLDPRPNRATIGLAYSKYWTHESACGVEKPPRSAWRRHRTAQRNSYLNAHYGYQLSPAAARPPPLAQLTYQAAATPSFRSGRGCPRRGLAAGGCPSPPSRPGSPARVETTRSGAAGVGGRSWLTGLTRRPTSARP